MTPELLTVGVGGVALAGLILSSHRTLIQRLGGVDSPERDLLRCPNSLWTRIKAGGL